MAKLYDDDLDVFVTGDGRVVLGHYEKPGAQIGSVSYSKDMTRQFARDARGAEISSRPSDTLLNSVRDVIAHYKKWGNGNV